MAKGNIPLQAFNRGIISNLALARTDIDRVALSAEIQTNWMPRTLGSMMLRPGFGYLGATKSNLTAKTIPFIFSTTDTADLEFTNQTMRVWVDDALVTRPSVSASITNGEFTSDLASWTDQDESGATSSWLTGGYLSLLGTGFNAAIREQQIVITETGTVHALRIVVKRGPVIIQAGSASGLDDFITKKALGTGTHSLAFIPTNNVFLQFSSTESYSVLVDSVAIEGSGTLELPTPWLEDDLFLLRWDQSGDVIEVACDGYLQKKIERRANNSWSVVNYEPIDGPFQVPNTGPTNLTPSALTGDITLTASKPLFKSTHVGALFRIDSIGQQVTAVLTGENQFTDDIRVTGVGSTREFSISITGVFTATVTLQQSVGAPGAWVDISPAYTTATSTTYNDTLDNNIIYYRIGIKSGDYTSGTATATLTYSGGSRTGIVRVTSVASTTSASAIVLSHLGGTTASSAWSEGQWSPKEGYPTSVAFYEGRLWWAGKDKINGSASDAFESFDDEIEGDSGPISRSIGSGPVATINWLLPMERLLIGTDAVEASARSSSFDEPLTPTNFNIKTPSTQGSNRTGAIKVDSQGFFVQRSGRRVYSLDFDSKYYNYTSFDMTALSPDVCSPGVKVMAVQRQPDTRLHCVLTDGTVAVMIVDAAENVRCWVKVETDGQVEDVVVQPGTEEDKVTYTIKRTINGSTVRFRERWALESECQGGSISKCLDSHIVKTGGASKIVTGLSHLEGETVAVWADGKDLGTYTVSGGSITLSSGVANAVVGLTYTGRFKSTKLAYAASMGTALTQRKRINSLALILANTHYQGIQYGPDFNTMDDLPLIENGEEVSENTVWDSYDSDSFTFPGEWHTDSRLCLQATAPRPAIVLSAIIGMTTHDGS